MWQELLSTLFPKRCLGCEVIIPSSQYFLCEICKGNLPFTGICFDNKNSLHEKINTLAQIEYISSLLIFNENSITQKLIHYLKYKNSPEIGEWLADIWFQQNKNNPNIIKIESVIPVPIHHKRLKQRNYNQVELCARRLASLLKCDLDNDILIRTQHLKSQTQSDKYQRLKRMENAFSRTNHKSKHFLLIDDVFTTGSTLISCSKELLKIEGTKVSIFTLAWVP